MFFKFIIGLLLAIAVGVLGGSSLGEGFFGFKTTASATKIVEDIRDIGVAMQTFKAADDQVRTAVQVADASDTTADNWTSAQVIGLVGADGAGYLEAGADNTAAGLVNFAVSGTGVYATVDADTNGITADMCNELNDLFGNDDALLFGTEAVPVIPAAADLDAALVAVPDLVNGSGTEGACVAINNVNTLVYYVQQN